MNDEVEFRTFHGIPAKTFQHGPLYDNQRPISAPMNGRIQAPRYPIGSPGLGSNFAARDMEQNSSSMMGYDAAQGHEYGTRYHLDEKGRWIEPEVSRPE